jgi:hypothetical protein
VSGVRFVTSQCAQATCTASCDENERILNAYAVGAGGTIVYTSERQVTFQPTKRGFFHTGTPSPGSLVLSCVPK